MHGGGRNAAGTLCCWAYNCDLLGYSQKSDFLYLFHENQAKVDTHRAIFPHRTDQGVGCTPQFSCKGRDQCCVSELYRAADLPVTSSWNGIWNIHIGSVHICNGWVQLDAN